MIDREARKALIDSLEVGDLISLNGRLRIVRDIGRRPNRKSPLLDDQVYSIVLSIQRCSWTRRPYTVRNRCDLYNENLFIVQKAYGTEHGPLEVMLQDEIEKRSGFDKRILECCDVIGVLS